LAEFDSKTPKVGKQTPKVGNKAPKAGNQAPQVDSPTLKAGARNSRSQGPSPALSGFEFLILVLFFGSGAGALVYEVVWSRLLTYTFGGSAFAIATVLAAYMAGLALGSAWFGRRIDRRGHPLAVYAALELGIGVWAVILPVLLGGLDSVYGLLYRDLHLAGFGLALVRFTLCFLVLLVPTTLMGGTLPVLGKLLLNRSESLGTRAAWLYGANTAGAVLGVAAAGFLLVPELGMRGATWVAVAVNVLVAAVAGTASRRVPFPAPASPAPEPAGSGDAAPAEAGARRLRAAVLAVYAASGFAALAYEVAWTKTLSLILGTSTYAFTSMLTTFLLGLAIGSFLFGRLADRLRRPEALLGVVQLGITVFSLLSIPALIRLPQLYVNAFPALRESWFSLELYRILLAGMVMILPTVLMGGTFPLAARSYARQASLGSSLGRLYAFNTVGAILGSFLAGFVLIPLLGRQQTIVAASVVNLAAAAYLLAVLRGERPGRALGAVRAAAALALIPALVLAVRPWDRRLISAGAYYYPDRMAAFPSILDFQTGQEFLYYRETTEAVVVVNQNQNLTSLRINGKTDASSHGDMVTQKLSGQLGMLYHRGPVERCLAIGLASGVSAGSLLTYDVDRVDVAELIREVTEACRYFDPYNHACLEDPRLHVVINDARNQLLLSPETYDVIASEPPNPYVAGVGSLFTREFFDLVKRRLRPDGVFCQWIQLYHMRNADLRAVLGTFAEAFPYVQLWSGGEGDLLVLGSGSPLELDREVMENRITGKVAEDLDMVDTLPLPHLLSFFVTDRDGVLAFVGDDPQRVTDDNLFLEYSIPRHMFGEGLAGTALAFRDVAKSPLVALRDAPDSAFAADVETYREARDLARRALNTPELLPRGVDQGEAMRRAHAMAPAELISRHWLADQANEEGIRALQAGRTDEARFKFENVLGFGDRPERALAWINQGYIAFEAGDLDRAGDCWEKAETLEPANPATTYNIGLLAALRGDHARAARAFGASLRYDPQAADTRSSYAFHLALSGGDVKQCLALAREAVDEDPSVDHLVNLGAVLVVDRQWQAAAENLNRALDEAPNHLEGRLQLAAAQVGLGDADAARRTLAPVAASPDDPERARRARELLETL